MKNKYGATLSLISWAVNLIIFVICLFAKDYALHIDAWCYDSFKALVVFFAITQFCLTYILAIALVLRSKV